MHLELSQVSKTYGKTRALDSVSMELQPGQVIALLGSNGAGKSTLLRLLSGLVKPDRGEIRYDGQEFDINDLALRRRLFFLPDFPPVFVGESVLSNLGLLLRLYQADGGDAPDRLVQRMQALDLLELAEKPIEQLSRGQSYKAVLAALLTIDPELWLLDEPLASGMDPQGLAVLRSEVRAAAARGRTIVFSTQILEAAERLADTVCVLHRGQIRLFEPIASLRHHAENPTDAVIDALLKSLRDP
jgi:ABC-2 type transport system ATP-binding protein